MNREVNKTKDLHDFVLLITFILAVISIFSGSLSYKKYSSQNKETPVIVVTDDPYIVPTPTYVPSSNATINTPTKTNNNSSNSYKVSKVVNTYVSKDKLNILLNNINSILISNINSSNSEFNSYIESLNELRNDVMYYLSIDTTTAKFINLSKKYESLNNSINAFKNNISNLVNEKFLTFSLSSSLDNLNELNRLINSLPDGDLKTDYLNRILLITNYNALDYDSFIIAINSEIANSITINFDYINDELSDIDINYPKIINGNSHVFNSNFNINSDLVSITDLSISGVITISNSNNILLNNINLNKNTSYINLVNGNITATNISKVNESLDDPFMISDLVSVVDGFYSVTSDTDIKYYLNKLLVISRDVATFDELTNSLDEDLVTVFNLTADIHLESSFELNKNISIISNGYFIYLDSFDINYNEFLITGDDCIKEISEDSSDELIINIATDEEVIEEELGFSEQVDDIELNLNDENII